MQTFKEFLREDEIEYLIIDIPEILLDSKILIQEGRWIPSGKKNYMIRVDQPTDDTQQRHVHVAKNKYINTKTQQASWNQDTSRHDKKTFNTKVGATKIVQDIAKQALKLDANIILEEYRPTKIGLILEKMELNPQSTIEPNCRLTVIL